MSDHTVTITADNWDAEVSQSNPSVVLVDFWAEWCNPCKAIAPTLDQLAEELTGKVKIGKVDIVDQRPLADKFGIQSIPSLLIFKAGELVEQTGPANRAVLQEKLLAHCD